MLPLILGNLSHGRRCSHLTISASSLNLVKKLLAFSAIMISLVLPATVIE